MYIVIAALADEYTRCINHCLPFLLASGPYCLQLELPRASPLCSACAICKLKIGYMRTKARQRMKDPDQGGAKGHLRNTCGTLNQKHLKKSPKRISIMAQQKRIRLGTVRLWV